MTMRRGRGGHSTGLAIAVAALLCVAPEAQGRGLLGLFADEPDAAPAMPVAAAAEAAALPPPNRPLAWISALRGVTDPAAQLYGYVSAGTRIDLGAEGELTLTWLSPCREENVIGGVVTVTPNGPQVSGAPAPNSRALSCQPLELVLPDERAPTPRTPAKRAPAPVAVNAAEPLFAWPPRPGAGARISVTDPALGDGGEIWSAHVDGNAAPYPHEAPRLEEHKPYLARALFDDGVAVEARFSFDPDLRYSNAPINAMVMLRPGATP